jgi:predicted MFS family arabinose efflux permease
MSLVVASLSGAGIVGVPLLAFVGGIAGWRVAFLVFALAALLGMPLVFRALPADPARTAAVPGVTAIVAAYRPLWHHRATVAVLGSTFLRGIAWSGAVTYLSGFFAQQYGYLPAQFAVVMLIAGVAYMVGSVITGRLTGVPPRTGIGVATIALAVLLGLTYLLPIGAVGTIAFLTGACVVAAFGWVHLTTVLASETPAGRGTTMIFQGVLFNLGGAAGGAVGGVLIAYGGYAALGIGFPCFAIASALCVWRPRAWIAVRAESGEHGIASQPVARRAQT